MHDDEILTKQLSDWKPETDIPLIKALGKFVEESGELLEAIYDYQSVAPKDITVPLENEMADVDAFIATLELVSNKRINPSEFLFQGDHVVQRIKSTMGADPLKLLVHDLGDTLTTVGRCQIQGLDKKDPETKIPNTETLTRKLAFLRSTLQYVAAALYLDKGRIISRTKAKIESKMPWMMGTATDLLPDE